MSRKSSKTDTAGIEPRRSARIGQNLIKAQEKTGQAAGVVLNKVSSGGITKRKRAPKVTVSKAAILKTAPKTKKAGRPKKSGAKADLKPLKPLKTSIVVSTNNAETLIPTLSADPTPDAE